MARKRNNKRYSEEFKLEAVKLSEKVGVPKAAKDLGVDSKSILQLDTAIQPQQ
jgi:transposase-like protein